MRIHTNLTELELYCALDGAGDIGLDCMRHGSRKRPHAFEVTLTGCGARHTRRKNHGAHGAGDEFAATWSDWGRWLASLYERDPALVCPHYTDAEDFHSKTFYLFNTMGMDDNEPARLANTVRELVATTDYLTRTGAIDIVARRRGLPQYIVKRAIFGE